MVSLSIEQEMISLGVESDVVMNTVRLRVGTAAVLSRRVGPEMLLPFKKNGEPRLLPARHLGAYLVRWCARQGYQTGAPKVDAAWGGGVSPPRLRARVRAVPAGHDCPAWLIDEGRPEVLLPVVTQL